MLGSSSSEEGAAAAGLDILAGRVRRGAVVAGEVTVAGLVIKKLLEAEEGLMYKYSWNKRNVYNQKVFGSAAVRVSVGYQYRECGSVVWDTRTARLGGYPVDITNIGGWNLNIHHHLLIFQYIILTS